MYLKTEKNKMIRVHKNKTITSFKANLKLLEYKRSEIKKFVKKNYKNEGIGVLEYKKNGNILMVYDELTKKYKNLEIFEIEKPEEINTSLVDNIVNKAKEKIVLLTIYMDFNKFKKFIKEKTKDKYFDIFNQIFFIVK